MQFASIFLLFSLDISSCKNYSQN